MSRTNVCLTTGATNDVNEVNTSDETVNRKQIMTSISKEEKLVIRPDIFNKIKVFLEDENYSNSGLRSLRKDDLINKIEKMYDLMEKIKSSVIEEPTETEITTINDQMKPQQEKTTDYSMKDQQHIQSKQNTANKTFAEIIKEKKPLKEKINSLIKASQQDHKVHHSINIKNTEDDSLKKQLKNIQIINYKKSNENTTIVFADKQNAEKAVKQLNSANISVNRKEELKPRMIIKHILKENENEEIINDIHNKNNFKENEIRIVTSYNVNNDYKNVIIEMEAKTRIKIIQNGSKLYIGFQVCYLEDNHNIRQCYHCQKFEHTAKECRNKEEQPKCLYCAENHHSKVCPNKRNKNKYKCCNCGESHTSNSKTCKVFMRQIARQIQNTNYNTLN